jgi:hypothetical protein
MMKNLRRFLSWPFAAWRRLVLGASSWTPEPNGKQVAPAGVVQKIAVLNTDADTLEGFALALGDGHGHQASAGARLLRRLRTEVLEKPTAAKAMLR